MKKKVENPERSRRVVFVGLSGGVDSAVSAALLKKQGFEVVGVFMKTWHPEFLECNEEEERRDAMRVAAHLDIPFLTFNFAKEYKKAVAEYMIREYRAGRTPNPDVMCNKEVKFGAFLKKAVSMGANYVATGHYAKKYIGISSDAEEIPMYLQKGKDPAKDQSYFLWTLTQKQLSKIIFPISSLKKVEVRKLAKKFGLPVSEKKDSQGICFLGAVDLKEFLKYYIKERKGRVVSESGKEIGHHNGVVFHTMGERHGFIITKKSPTDGPYYVVGKDAKKNILIVSQDKEIKHSGILKNIRIENINWISEVPKEHKTYTAQIRYHGEFLPCRVSARQDLAEVVFKKPVLVAPGQSCVIYNGNICLGGGVII